MATVYSNNVTIIRAYFTQSLLMIFISSFIATRGDQLVSHLTHHTPSLCLLSCHHGNAAQ